MEIQQMKALAREEKLRRQVCAFEYCTWVRNEITHPLLHTIDIPCACRNSILVRFRIHATKKTL